MEKNKNIDTPPASITEKFRMEPPSGAWNLLNAELDKRQAVLYRKKASRFRLLSIGLALLLISFVSFYYLTSPHQSKSLVNVAGKSLPADDKSINSSVHHDNIEANNKPFASNSPVSNHSSGVETISSPASSSKAKSISTTPVKPEHNVSYSPLAKAENHVAISETHQDVHIGSKRISAENNNNTGISSQSVKTPASVEKENIATNDDNLKIINNHNDILPALSAKSDPRVLSENKNVTSDQVKQDLKENNSSTSNPPASEDQPAKAVESAQPGPVQGVIENNPAKDSSQNKENIIKSRWALSLYYMPHHSRNRLEDNNPNDGESPSEYTTREKTLFAFASGLALRYNFTDRWSASAGAGYSTMAYSISIPTIFAEYGSDNQLHYQYPTSCGIIEMPNSYHYKLQNGDSLRVNATCEQILKFINVPLTVRYQVPLNRFTLYAQAGASANFLIQEKATVTIWNSETTIVNNIDGLKKINYSFLLAMGVEYHIHSGIGLFMEPTYTGAITSLTENTSLDCYPYSLGLNMGISFHF